MASIYFILKTGELRSYGAASARLISPFDIIPKATSKLCSYVGNTHSNVWFTLGLAIIIICCKSHIEIGHVQMLFYFLDFPICK